MNKNRQLKINRRKSVKIASFFIFLAFMASIGDIHAKENNRITSPVEQIITQKKVSIHLNNKSLRFIIMELQKLSGIGMAFKDEGDVDKYTSLSINAKDATVEDILNKVLSTTDLTYTINRNTVIIAKKAPKPTIIQNKPTSNRIKVNGTILISGTKSPVVGATIIVDDIGTGAISDDKGNFSLNATSNSKLTVSYIGMKEVLYNKPLTNNANITIEMEHDAMAVDDVIVTGIFNKAKESYTGSVTTVTAKDLKMFRGSNILKTLSNIDPALNMVVDNTYGSDPNRLPEINIRGNSSLPMSVKELNENAQAQLNTPLIIMDGFEVNLQKLMDFNDEEIESINIMKDASATAIYGSRGANGVIVVTTKAPQVGKLKVYIKAGINIEMPDLTTYDILNASEKLELERRAGLYDNVRADSDVPLKERYARFLKNVNAGVNTDWMAQPVQTGIGQKYNLRLEGGSNEFRWSTSASYYNTKGAMKTSDKNTFTGSISLSYQFKNLIFKNQTSISTNKGTNSKYGSFDTYVKQNPYHTIYDEDGNINKTLETTGGSKLGNPIYDATLNTKDENSYFEVINNFSIDWRIVDELRAVAKFGISKQMNNSDYFLPASHSSFNDNKGSDYFRRGVYNYSDGDTFNYDASVTLNYSKLIHEKHQLYVGLDLSLLQRKNYTYNFVLEGFNNDKFDFLPNANYYKDGKPSGSESLTRSVGATANFNYTYDNRYFVDLSYRMDGSSQFGSKQKFAPFWSAGIGWNIHRESFMKDFKAISNFRLRGSIGETGSQAFNSYQALATYQYYVGDRYLGWNGAYLMALGNESLKWQKTRQINGAVEVGLWGNRLSASIDVYQKKTSNLLSQMDLPSIHGFSSYTENVGEVTNNGYELMLSGYILRNTNRNLLWSVTGRLSLNNSKITKLSDAIKKQTEQYKLTGNSNSDLLIEGDPQNSIYVVPSFGIDPSTGQELFLDRFGNVTYTWDSRDRVYYGISQPKYRGNMSTMFSYKDFTLNLSFGYHWGGKSYNSTLMNKIENADLSYNVDRRVYEERWQKVGDVVFFKDLKSTKKTNYTSRFVQTDNMFQLQSASISYRFTQEWLKKKLKIQSLDLGCNMSDIFYLSTVKQERGTSYPFARRVEFSLSLLF